MTFRAYKDWTPSKQSQFLVAYANEIIEEYADDGYTLTLRQLYYQFVARDLIPNNQRSYNNLGSIINRARLAGMISWEAIVDRTRNLESNSHWQHPSDIVRACAQQYRVDMWKNQEYRPEVWIEKDALMNVLEGICPEWDIPYFSCRGYTSQSELWAAGQRMIEYTDEGKIPLVIHLGDHDPSGIDMTRDITDRLNMFTEYDGVLEVRRIALNMDQIQQYKPPPNPAKFTDSRASGYVEQYGRSSWELDALSPNIIEGLIKEVIDEIIDAGAWRGSELEQTLRRGQLAAIAMNWDKATKAVEK